MNNSRGRFSENRRKRHADWDTKSAQSSFLQWPQANTEGKMKNEASTSFLLCSTPTASNYFQHRGTAASSGGVHSPTTWALPTAWTILPHSPEKHLLSASCIEQRCGVHCSQGTAQGGTFSCGFLPPHSRPCVLGQSARSVLFEPLG